MPSRITNAILYESVPDAPGSAGAGPRHQKSVSGAGWVVSLKSLIAGLVEEWRGRCEPGVTDVDR